MYTVKILLAILGFLSCLNTVHGALPPKRYSTKTADAAMKIEDWSAAETEFERIINSIRATPISLPGFGAIYFKKGWCEYKQKKWKESMSSFEQCYKKYPSTQKDKNPFHKEALRWWAEAAYMSEDYQTSAKLFRKYLDEKTNKK